MVDWNLARTGGYAGALTPPACSSTNYSSAALQAQFDEADRSGREHLVSEATGLHSAHGAARARVTDRSEWAVANVRYPWSAWSGRPWSSIQAERRG